MVLSDKTNYSDELSNHKEKYLGLAGIKQYKKNAKIYLDLKQQELKKFVKNMKNYNFIIKSRFKRRYY